MNYDVVNAFKFSFSWLKKKESLKYFGLFWLIYAILIMFLVGIFFVFFPSIITNILAGNFNAIVELFSDLNNIIFLISTIALVGLIVFLLFILLNSTLVMLMFYFSFRQKKIEYPKFTLSKLINFLILGFMEFLAAMFYPFNKKLRYATWAIILLMILASASIFVGFPLFAIALIPLSIIYFLIIFYNRLRFFVSEVIFLSEEIPKREVLHKAWDLSRDNAFNIFITSIVVSISATILFGIILTLINWITSLIILGVGYDLSAMLLVTNVIVFSFNFLLAPINMLVSVFVAVGIYWELIHD